MDVLHLRPVRLSSLVCPSLPMLMVSLDCATKQSNLSSGLSSAMRTRVRCSAEFRSILRCRFTSLTTIPTRPFPKWCRAEPSALQHKLESPRLHLISPRLQVMLCSARCRTSTRFCGKKTKSFMKSTRHEISYVVVFFRSQDVAQA